jgi:hypothetical protein
LIADIGTSTLFPALTLRSSPLLTIRHAIDRLTLSKTAAASTETAALSIVAIVYPSLVVVVFKDILMFE